MQKKKATVEGTIEKTEDKNPKKEELHEILRSCYMYMTSFLIDGTLFYRKFVDLFTAMFYQHQPPGTYSVLICSSR